MELMHELEPHLHVFLGLQSARSLALGLLHALLPSLSDAQARDVISRHVVTLLSRSLSVAPGAGGAHESAECRLACLSILASAWEARPELREATLRAPLLLLLGDDDDKVSRRRS